MAMKLSTGKVAFPIEFDNGDKDTIYFNPNDPDLALRLIDLRDKISAKVRGLDDVKVGADGTPSDENAMATFRKIKDVLCEELDTAFGGDISSVVFKHCSPFALVGGEYFFVQFIEVITPEIKKHMKKASKEIEKKMQKHTGKYSE